MFFGWGEEEGDAAAPDVDTWTYVVVYPGGVAVRSGPSVDAPQAEPPAVLAQGDVLEATKSLRLDGITYVKLADGRGW